MTFLVSCVVSIADDPFAHAEHIHVVVFDVLRTKVGRSRCGSSPSSGYWNRLEDPGGKKPTLRLFSRYGPALRRSARKDRCELLTLQARASDQRAADLRQRQDRARIRGLDGTAIEDAHRPTLGAQMFNKATADMRVHLNDFL
jgi:hypothetical protein